MRLGRLAFQKTILAIEIAILLLGAMIFVVGHSWLRQEDFESILQEAESLADEVWRAGAGILEDGEDGGE